MCYQNRGLFALILGSGNSSGDPAAMMKAQQQMAMGGMGAAATDMTKQFTTEKNELSITKHEFRVPFAEQRLIEGV